MWYLLSVDEETEGMDSPNAEALGSMLLRSRYPNEECHRYGKLREEQNRYIDNSEMKKHLNKIKSEYKYWISMMKSQTLAENDSSAWVSFNCEFDPFSEYEGECRFEAKYIHEFRSRSHSYVIIRESNGNTFKLDLFDAPGLFASVMFVSYYIFRYTGWTSEYGFDRRSYDCAKLSFKNYQNYVLDKKVMWDSDDVKFLNNKCEYSKKEFHIMRIMEKGDCRYRHNDLKYMSSIQLERLL